MVQIINLSQEEQELVNQFFMKIENIINEGKEEEIENIIAPNSVVEGVLQAYMSMLIRNFKDTLGRFRIYPRYIKRMNDGSIKIHSSTQIAPGETEDLTWSLIEVEEDLPKLVIESISNRTIPIYEAAKNPKTEIPVLGEKWKHTIRTQERVELINRMYMKIKEQKGKQQAKMFFNDSEKFDEELNEIFSFLEGEYKLVAYIALIGANVYGWKGKIFQNEDNYEIIFNEFKDLEVLERIADLKKMTEKEYIELIRYIWRKRAEKQGAKIKIEIEKEKERITFRIPKKKTKIITGERTVKRK